MTDKERLAINQCCERLKDLASMENCCVSEACKKEIRPYMQWFISTAFALEKMVVASNKYEMEDAIEYIMLYIK